MSEKELLLIKQMLHTIERIFEYNSKIDIPEDYSKNYKTFDAILFNFIILAEIEKKLKDKFKNNYPNIEWSKIQEFKKITEHVFGIDEEEIFWIIKTNITKLKNDLKNLLNNYKNGN